MWVGVYAILKSLQGVINIDSYGHEYKLVVQIPSGSTGHPAQQSKI